MKMNFGNLAILGTALAASASFTATAHAGIVTGVAYCDIAANTGGQGSSYAIDTPTLAQLATAESTSGGECAAFTANNINFNTGYGNPGSSLASFLNSGGPGNLISATYFATAPANGNVNGLSTGSDTAGSQNDDGTLFFLTGTGQLQTGESITLSHDDGALIYVCPIASDCTMQSNYVLISPLGSDIQTVGGQSPFTFTLATGSYNFDLIYNTNYEQPAELISSINTPEPSSLVLFGTGLLGAAGLLMRRRHAATV